MIVESVIKKLNRKHHKRLAKKLVTSGEIPSKEELIQHFQHLMIRCCNCENEAESSLLSISVGVLNIIDPLQEQAK